MPSLERRSLSDRLLWYKISFKLSLDGELVHIHTLPPWTPWLLPLLRASLRCGVGPNHIPRCDERHKRCQQHHKQVIYSLRSTLQVKRCCSLRFSKIGSFPTLLLHHCFHTISQALFLALLLGFTPPTSRLRLLALPVTCVFFLLLFFPPNLIYSYSRPSVLCSPAILSASSSNIWTPALFPAGPSVRKVPPPAMVGGSKLSNRRPLL